MDEQNVAHVPKIDFTSSRIRFTEEDSGTPPAESPTKTESVSTVPVSISASVPPPVSLLKRLSQSFGPSNPSPNQPTDSSSPLDTEETTVKNHIAQREAKRSVKTYFAFRDGGHTMATAIKECLPVIMDTGNRDGTLLGVWLLTEISHWDVELERLLFLTERTLIIVKYDMIQLTLLEYRRVPLHLINRCIYGSLRYPVDSIFQDRNQTGLRMMWDTAEAAVPNVIKWNPFAEVPYATFTSHSASSDLQSDVLAGSGITSCLLDTFLQQFMTVLRKETESHHHHLRYEENEILIENYAGIASRIFNKAQLGFFKSRGRICF